MTVAAMTKSWVSGGKNSDLAERLRAEITELESARDELVEKNKKAVFEWSSFILNSRSAPRDADGIRDHPLTQEVRDVLARYERLNQQILDKQVTLNEKLDEQAKFDSLG
jgi:hypothetical protein